MSGKYRIGEDGILHFITFSVVYWIDALTRTEYKDIFLESLRYCIKEKGLLVHAWVIMSKHVHLIIRCKGEANRLSNNLRDCKKYTSRKIMDAIQNNPRESRREWMIEKFAQAGKLNSNNVHCQFWQQDNHPVQLITNFMIEQRLRYLHENPVRALLVLEPQEYVFSSAVDYYTNRRGRLAIERL